jgi:uncharacterized protein YeaO (DUF488 family)
VQADLEAHPGMLAKLRFFGLLAPHLEGRGLAAVYPGSGGNAMIQLKRVYEKPSRRDGLRILVDRLWPRGLTKERAAVKLWLKDVAPSTELRKWFGHDPAKWKQFQVRYRKELREKNDAIELLEQESEEHTVTLVYGARDEEHNEALVLKSVLEGRRTTDAG